MVAEVAAEHKRSLRETARTDNDRCRSTVAD